MHVHVATYNINSTGHYTYTNSRYNNTMYHHVWFTFIFWISFTQDHWNSYPTLYAKRTTVYRYYLIGQTDTQHNNFDNIFQYLIHLNHVRGYLRKQIWC